MNIQSTYVVCANYIPKIELNSDKKIFFLPLWIGEYIKIVAEYNDWCFGYYMFKPFQSGIFPKNFLQKVVTDQNLQINEAQQLISEITETVKIWWHNIKKKYKDINCSFKNHEDYVKLVKDLMITRNKLRSDNIPTEELKEIRLLIAQKIDAGNYFMGLNMHIRDELGKIIKADELSLLNAYKQHELTYAKLATIISENSKFNSFSILININTTSDIKFCSQDAEFSVALIDGKTNEVISELLTLYWFRSIKRFAHNFCQGIFTDLTDQELNNNNLMLVVTTFKLFFIDKPDSFVKQENLSIDKYLAINNYIENGVKQLYAKAEINITELIRNTVNKEKREVMLNLLKINSTQSNFATSTLSNSVIYNFSSKPLSLFFSNRNLNNTSQTNFSYKNLNELHAISSMLSLPSSFDNKLPLSLTLQLLPNLFNFQDLNNENFLSTNQRTTAILQKIRLTNSNFDLKKNEVYVTLKSADIKMGKLSTSSTSNFGNFTEKCLEAVCSLWDSNSNQVTQCFETITPEKNIYSDSFNLCMLTREEKFFFNQTFKIILPKHAIKDLHVRILFYYRKLNNKNGSEFSNKKSSNVSKNIPVALSFFYIIQNYALVSDCKNIEGIELCVYKIDLTKFNEKCVLYLRLNAKRNLALKTGTNMTINSNYSRQDLNLLSCGAFTLMEKNFCSVHYSSNSSYHTKNLKLLHIFRWRQIGATSAILNDRIRDILNATINFDENEEIHNKTILNFLSPFLDALFQIAADKEIAQKTHLSIFDALVYVIRLCEEPKNSSFMKILLNYVEKFSFATAYEFLLNDLIWYIENKNESNKTQQQKEISTKNCLLPILKSIGMLMQIIVASKNCFDLVNVFLIKNDRYYTFKNVKKFIFSEKINYLMKILLKLMCNGSTAQITCQNAALKYFPTIISPLLKFQGYKPINLTYFIKILIENLSQQIIIRQKLNFLADVIATNLFNEKDCRKILLQKFLDELLFFLSPYAWNKQASVFSTTLNLDNNNDFSIIFQIKKQHSSLKKDKLLINEQDKTFKHFFTLTPDLIEMIELSAKIVCILLEKLFPNNSVSQHGTNEELKLILHKIIRPINQSIIVFLKNLIRQRALHQLLLAILDKFSAELFLKYLNNFCTKIDCVDMLSEMLHMFRDLLQQCPLLKEWYQMRCIQHKIFIKILRFVKAFILQQFKTKNLFNLKELYQKQICNKINQTLLTDFAYLSESQFILKIWFECMLTAIEIIKSIMTIIESDEFSNSISILNKSYEKTNHNLCKTAAIILRSLWFSLNVLQKIMIFSKLLKPILEVVLYEKDYLHEIIIPIFYDMFEIQCFWLFLNFNTDLNFDLNIYENYIDKDVLKKNNFNNDILCKNIENLNANSNIEDFNASSKNCSSNINYSLLKNNEKIRRLFVDEFIVQLDLLLDSNHGGPIFRSKFRKIFLEQCMFSPTMQSLNSLNNNFLTKLQSVFNFNLLNDEVNIGLQFVEKVDKLLELLLEYRQVRINSDCIENGMFCTVQLINFYQKIEQNELYVNYLYKLYDLHIMSGNNVEAALTLKKHAALLKWNDELLENYLTVKSIHKCFKTHVKLKEQIYIEIADLFDKGEHWEQAVEILKELISVYENVIIDFVKLSLLLQRLSELYLKITTKIRMENNYFLVAFYGDQVSNYLSRRKFVFRGEKLEQWNSFKERMLHTYFGYKLIESVDNCDEQYLNAKGKFIQIIPITPQPSKNYFLLNKSQNYLISWYYKHHQIQSFEHLRREMKTNTKWTHLDENDATKLWIKRKLILIEKTLPDILKFAPIISEIEPKPANPVDVAIIKIQEINDQLKEIAQLVAAGFVQFLVNLGGCIRGVVQADVGGGIKNYKTFFMDEFWHNLTESEQKSILLLKTLLCEHVIILEYALYVHALKPSQINNVFHNSLVQAFINYRQNIEERFGKVKSILPLGASIYLEQNLKKQNLSVKD